MTTLREAAFNVLNLMTGGRSTNNEYLSLEQIKFAIHYYRALMLRSDMQKGDQTRPFEQSLGILTLNESSLGGEVFTRNGIFIQQTSKTIPRLVRLKSGKEGLTYVGPPDLSENFPIVDYRAAMWQRYNRFTFNNRRAFIYDDYVHVVGDPVFYELEAIMKNPQYVINESAIVSKEVSCIAVRGIFEDTIEAGNFSKAADDPPYTDRDPFPISSDMIQRITQGLISGEMNVMIQSPNDTQMNTIPDHKKT